MEIWIESSWIEFALHINAGHTIYSTEVRRNGYPLSSEYSDNNGHLLTFVFIIEDT